MSHYGISAIHWNAALDDIDEVRLRKVVRQEPEGGFAITHGERLVCADVANLIRSGDTVWVMVDAGLGRYRNTDRVGVGTKPSGHEHLFSCTEDDTPTTALTDLPRYRKRDDPPPEPSTPA